MNETQNAVQAATNPQAALLQIAISLDRLHEKLDDFDPPGEDWGPWSTPAQTTTLNVTTDEAGDRVIEFPVVDEERYRDREAFAFTTLNLKALGTDEDYIGAYAKGGARWLYEYDRELVISYPTHVKQQMITDVEQDDPQAAQEMARDILKVAASGMDSGVLTAEGRVG